MTVNGIRFDSDELMSKEELLSFLRENGASDRALSHLREQQYVMYDNELMWRYPISDGMHLGTFIVPVKEGFISLPYNTVETIEGEILELQDAAMFDEDAMQNFIEDWRLFSDDLLSAMTDMLRILRGK